MKKLFARISKKNHKQKEKSIVNQITILLCLILSVVLISGNFFLIKLESELVESLTQKHLLEINQTIDEQMLQSQRSLEQDLQFNVEILNSICAIHLYNVDPFSMKQTLRSFMKYPEITAIQVLDEMNRPFMSAWKNNEIVVKEIFPDRINNSINHNHSINVKTTYSGLTIGRLTVYYTNEFLNKQIQSLKEKVIIETEQIRADSKKQLRKSLSAQVIIVIGVLIVCILTLNMALRYQIIHPMKMLIKWANKISQYDLSMLVNSHKRNEMGLLFNMVNRIVYELRVIVQDAKTKSSELANSSRLMVDIAGKLSKNTDHIQNMANNVAGSSLQMTNNFNSIGSAAEQMSVNVKNVCQTTTQLSNNMNSVVKSVQEVSTSMNEAEHNARQGAEIANIAYNKTKTAHKSIKYLSLSANEIGDVASVIKRIAHKTTLLALNAAIEAASAGDSGKGFSVVANSIQQFAEKTNKAAEDISTRIASVQDNISDGVKSMTEISDIINNMNKLSELVAQSIHQQATNIQDIENNVNEADSRAKDIAFSMEELSCGAREVSMNISEANHGALIVSKTIHGVSKAITENHSIINDVNLSANKLDQYSEDLFKLVNKFIV